MITGIAIFFVCLAAWAIITVTHEWGHYIAGALVGIPRDCMKVRLLTWPPHVALKDGKEWVSPLDHLRYIALCRPFLKRKFEAIFYISGGLLAQTMVFGCAIFSLSQAGVGRHWLLPICSAILGPLGFYFFIDTTLSISRKRQHGDFSALWWISPPATLLILGIIFLANALIFAAVLRHA